MGLWTDTGSKRPRFGSAPKGAGHLDAVERVKEWTRVRFTLCDDETILVAENAATLPGCPALETVVAFWNADGARHHFKVFKPVEAVVEEDLPPAWLKESLALSEGVECACC
jgi:hypothetical protein